MKTSSETQHHCQQCQEVQLTSWPSIIRAMRRALINMSSKCWSQGAALMKESSECWPPGAVLMNVSSKCWVSRFSSNSKCWGQRVARWKEGWGGGEGENEILQNIWKSKGVWGEQELAKGGLMTPSPPSMQPCLTCIIYPI